MPTNPDLTKGEGLTRPHDTFDELRQDVIESYKLLENQKTSQFLRRVVVHAIFTFIEAVIEIIKIHLRSTIRLEQVELCEHELNLLGGTGLFPQYKKFLSLEKNIKPTFALAAKIWGLKNFELDENSDGYGSVLLAKKYRNQLTHPKTFYDIQVTDHDMHYHSVAFHFISEEFIKLLKARQEVLLQQMPDDIREGFYKSLQDMG